MSVASHARALELLAPHCDLVERLSDVPPSARVRGLYFKSVIAVLRRKGALANYEEFFPEERWSSLSFYPLGEYLVRLALAGAVVSSPAELHKGIFDITRANASAFAESLLGRVMVRILDRDPVRLTEQGLAARRQSTTYGEWEIVKRGPREVEMIYHAEYMWIESAIAGAATGTFEVCRLEPTLDTQLKDKYNGSTLVRW